MSAAVIIVVIAAVLWITALLFYIIIKLNIMSLKLEDFLAEFEALKTTLGAIREDVLHLLERLDEGREGGFTAEEVQALYEAFSPLKAKAEGIDELVPARETPEEPGDGDDTGDGDDDDTGDGI